jgi:MFS family permease
MTDIWFSHERPLYLAVYGLSLAASGKLAPVFAAFINTGQGWKWTLWWCAIGMAVAFVYCFFLMEETNYDRPSVSSMLSSSHSSSSVPAAKDNEVDESGSGSETKKMPKEEAVVEADSDFGQVIYPRKTYLQKLSLWGDKKRPNRILDIMWSPFKFFRFPVVVWAGFMYGTNALVWPGILNATASPTYTGKYGFDSNDVGFAYFGAVVGMVVG